MCIYAIPDVWKRFGSFSVCRRAKMCRRRQKSLESILEAFAIGDHHPSHRTMLQKGQFLVVRLGSKWTKVLIHIDFLVKSASLPLYKLIIGYLVKTLGPLVDRHVLVL